MIHNQMNAAKSSEHSTEVTPVRLLGRDWYDYSILGLMATVVVAIIAGFMGM